MDAHAMPQPIEQPAGNVDPAPLSRPAKPARGAMDFVSPTSGKVSFRQMFDHVVGYMNEEPD
ncbi:MAG TPA: hypothetical protein VFW08_12385, partial [bacterium]|nr:hypothetical protein [bacterium]